MKVFRNRFQLPALAGLAVCVLLSMVACTQHDDVPTPLNLIPPPEPSNVQIVDLGGGKYDITWDIDDPGPVSEYRVYTVGQMGFELVGSTTDQIFMVDTLFPIGGLIFGVAAVTIENVEGDIVTVVTPAPSAAIDAH